MFEQKQELFITEFSAVLDTSGFIKDANENL